MIALAARGLMVTTVTNGVGGPGARRLCWTYAMATHERELTEPVDLCTVDGRRLAPAARGYSRRPVHRANLAGAWGRTKRWDYWAILAGDLVISVTYADVDYLGIANVWWADVATGTCGGRDINVPLARGLALPEIPGSAPLRWDGSGLRLELADDEAGTHLRARWTERGASASLDALVERPEGHESMHVVIPWSETRFQYTEKAQALPARGELVIGEAHHRFGDDGDAWGVLDVGRGRWPYRTSWNWGGGAGRAADGRVVGLQLAGKWTVGTGFTENGLIVDGRLSKVGEELVWEYDWDAPMRPWSVHAPSGRLDVRLEPRYDRHSRTNAVVMGMEVHQVFGRWFGTVVADDGMVLRMDGIQGFAEEARSRW